MVNHGVHIMYQYLGSLPHQKQGISNNARCLETALYILTFYTLILHLHFNLIIFSTTSIDCFMVLRYICLPFTDI